LYFFQQHSNRGIYTAKTRLDKESKQSAAIQKFDYVFFPDTLNEPVGVIDRSSCSKLVNWLRKIRYTIYEFMYYGW